MISYEPCQLTRRYFSIAITAICAIISLAINARQQRVSEQPLTILVIPICRLIISGCRKYKHALFRQLRNLLFRWRRKDAGLGLELTAAGRTGEACFKEEYDVTLRRTISLEGGKRLLQQA